MTDHFVKLYPNTAVRTINSKHTSTAVYIAKKEDLCKINESGSVSNRRFTDVICVFSLMRKAHTLMYVTF